MKKIAAAALLMMFSLTHNNVGAQDISSDSLNAEIASLDAKVKQLTETIEKKSRLKISGYIQGQWQLAQEEGALTDFNAGPFPLNSNNRFSVQRGRFKFGYTYKNVSAVMQVDVTERGVGMKDAYVALFNNSKSMGLTAGVFNRPFGNEILYSSSSRETPERSRLYQTLFPSERDLGAQVTLEGEKGSVLNHFRFDGGLFAGNGPNSETNSAKDFIGRLEYTKDGDYTKFSLGTSVYAGRVLNETDDSYSFDKGTQSYIKNYGDSQGDYFKRFYWGVNTQFSQESSLGTTSVRAEYIMGQQPGTINSSKSPKSAVTSDIYNRKFTGCLVYLVQKIKNAPISIATRYDYYDPNRQISADKIGVNEGTGVADVAFSSLSTSAIWDISPMFRFMVNYEFVWNEKCESLNTALYDLTKNVKDNVLTLRMQVKF